MMSCLFIGSDPWKKSQLSSRRRLLSQHPTPPPAFSCVRQIHHRSAAVAMRQTSLKTLPPPAAAVWRSWTGRWPPPPPSPPRPPSPAALPPRAPPPESRRRPVAPRPHRMSHSGWSQIQKGWNTFWTFPKTSCAFLRGRRGRLSSACRSHSWWQHADRKLQGGSSFNSDLNKDGQHHPIMDWNHLMMKINFSDLWISYLATHVASIPELSYGTLMFRHPSNTVKYLLSKFCFFSYR